MYCAEIEVHFANMDVFILNKQPLPSLTITMQLRGRKLVHAAWIGQSLKR